MPIPVTLTFTAPVRNLTVYDHIGSDRPLLSGANYDTDAEVQLHTSNDDCCCGPRGYLEVRGEVQIDGEWEARESLIVAERGGEYAWP